MKNWRAIAKIGASKMYLPNGYCNWMEISHPITMPSYRPSYEPSKPIILSLFKYLAKPDLSVKEQTVQGRYELESKSFYQYEQDIRKELNYLFGPWGFNAKKDIAGIMINRWAHGYNFFKHKTQQNSSSAKVFQIGRKRIGNISFAGADAGGDPWIQESMDQGIRAVKEQLV